LRFFFRIRSGKGAALRRGFAEVTGDVVLVQDADLSTNPRIIRNCWSQLWMGERRGVWLAILGGPQRVHYFWHYVANRLLTLLSDIFYEFETDGYGDVLQGFSGRDAQGNHDQIQSFWI